MSVVRVILPCMMWLSHSSGLLRRKLCISFVLCVRRRVGTDPFQPGTYLHLFPPSKCWKLSYTFLDSLHHSHPCCWQSYSTCLCDIAVMALPYDPLLGLLHQTVWGLIGTSYRGYPLNMFAGPAPSTKWSSYIHKSPTRPKHSKFK